MQTAPKKVVNAWAMYDWANSAYNLVITSTIFPAYFEAIAVDDRAVSRTAVTFLGRTFENSALYNYTIAVALLIVACLSPLLSAIADLKGNKKTFMRFFLTMGSIGCSGLFFFENKKEILSLKNQKYEIPVVSSGIGYDFHNSYLTLIWRDKLAGILKILIWFGSFSKNTFFPQMAVSLRAGADTFLLWNFVNSGVADSTGRNVLESVGDARVVTSIKKYSTGSYYFDGTGDYLSIVDNSAFTLANYNFCIELWIYPTASMANYANFLGQWANSTTNCAYTFRTSVSQNVQFAYTTSGNGRD